jgi:hypothetical protein
LHIAPQHHAAAGFLDDGGIATAVSFGVQHAAAGALLEGVEDVGISPSVWNVSHATPCGSVTQYLSEVA